MGDAELRAQQFREAEASFRLEGLDPSGNNEYGAMKAGIISGDIDEAIRKRIEQHKSLQQSSVT